MCKDEQLLEVNIFGKNRMLDFTHFKPRGHYATQPELRMYFRAMTWLAKVDMIVAGVSYEQGERGRERGRGEREREREGREEEREEEREGEREREKRGRVNLYFRDDVPCES